MKRRTIEAICVGTLTVLAAVSVWVPAGLPYEVVRVVYLGLMGPLGVPGGAIQWAASVMVVDVTGVTGDLAAWGLSFSTFVLTSALLALVNVGLLRLVTRVVRAVRGRRSARRPVGAVAA